MQLIKTKFKGLIIYKRSSYNDSRGYFRELFLEKVIKKKFVFDYFSLSKKNVLRGIHGDKNTCKLVTCLYGEFYLVVVNNNPHSQQFKKWQSFNLSEKNRKQVLIPPMYGNGHLVISDKAIFHYKQTTEYNREGQFTIMWNDPDFKIKWPVKNPILSKRDGG